MNTSKDPSAYKPIKVEFEWPHRNPTDCQVFLALTGTREGIIEQLKNLVKQCEDSYGKPYQGRYAHFHCDLEVITPIWKGKPY